MLPAKKKIYLDTSVISAYYDVRQPERMALTQDFWRNINQYEVCVSRIVMAEIDKWIGNEKHKLHQLIKDFLVLAVDAKEIKVLARKYMDANVIPPSEQVDALHIAVASAHKIDCIVSWNFRHIVREKVRLGVNYINNLSGYGTISILAPAELL